VLDAHDRAGDGRFVGIRDALSRPLEPEALRIPGRALADRYLDASFRSGVRELGRRGLTYDTWHYHHQNVEMLALARAVPETTMILDHFGTPLGVGMYEGRHDEIFGDWATSITELATCPNVVAKLGGLAMPDNGFGWHDADRPPTSDEFVAAQAHYYHHTIEAFGPERCMFESNFPVDRLSLSYPVLWNALKKIAARYAPDERAAMFEGTARRIYGL
jgi:L-fuconolactonase